MPVGGERLVLTDIVTDADHGLVGVMLVARNLSYLTQVESTISYSRKLAALGRLSAGIAHEVKNPLNATMIHLELLKMQLADQPTAKEHLAIIAAQMRRLDEVVQGFLRFTRPEDLKLQKVRVGKIIEDLLPVIRAEAASHNVELRLECPPDLPPISADPGLLEQAFLNLAINACQAMPQGGRLRIAATARPGRRLEVVFEDTGVGIPPDQLARIFDLYFTTKEHGSGIGLSLVYRAVQLHDGEIEVPVGARSRNDVPAVVAPGRHNFDARRRGLCVIIKMVTLLPARAAVAILVVASVSACGKVKASVPQPMAALEMPAPPGRLIVPATIPEPSPEPVAPPAVQTPVRQNNPPATRPAERSTPPPNTTPTARADAARAASGAAHDAERRRPRAKSTEQHHRGATESPEGELPSAQRGREVCSSTRRGCTSDRRRTRSR